jgi:hypothetical protein
MKARSQWVSNTQQKLSLTGYRHFSLFADTFGGRFDTFLHLAIDFLHRLHRVFADKELPNFGTPAHPQRIRTQGLSPF